MEGMTIKDDLELLEQASSLAVERATTGELVLIFDLDQVYYFETVEN